MPIYEYLCQECGSLTEKIQKFSDPLLTECEDCGGSVSKVLSQSSFVLKGGGWYVTDYAKKSSSTTTEKADSKAESPSDAASPCGAQACGAGACAASEA
ncbi:MAG: zinc ribbon domain-containing protein [Blastocatellia bacterium]|nr:zinc ribbon domain-containing protein [Blastocatellia bacterium]